MNDLLAAHLSAIDERLLEYLDDEGQLRVDVVMRLQRFANALVEGSSTPELVAAEWPDFYDLTSAFVAAYGSPELQGIYDQANLEASVAQGRIVPIDDADRVLLVQLSEELEAYPGLSQLQPD